MDFKKLNLVLNVELHQQLKMKAIQANMPLYQFVITLLERG